MAKTFSRPAKMCSLGARKRKGGTRAAPYKVQTRDRPPRVVKLRSSGKGEILAEMSKNYHVVTLTARGLNRARLVIA